MHTTFKIHYFFRFIFARSSVMERNISILAWATTNSILYLISKSSIVVEVAKVDVTVVEKVEVDNSPFTLSNHLRKLQPLSCLLFESGQQ
ncbi:hypothetical protein GIB67_018978 [Kingdonia uniflora]|uniref:Uncharacterized protein n=1 Tax=Kingdonia uniflora TaxID=39325 RepID=A0A7J7MGP7_9MAGN|nr:hypothetical protein GIB67_018978 [Kingdonia uniflora]